MSGTVPSRDAFAARYRSLAVDERGAFVADLRAARGWETAVEGAVVVAKRGGTTRRIAVGQPDGETTVDAVVTADERLGSLAETRDAEFIEPGALRDELCYALDTQNGTELLEAHFGETELALSERVGGTAGTQGSQADSSSSLQGRGPNSPSLGPKNRQTRVERSKAGPGGGQPEADSQSAASGGGPDETEGVVSLATVLAAGVVFVLLFVLASGSGAVAFSELLSNEDGVEATDPGPEAVDGQAGITDNSTTESETDATDVSDEGRKSRDSSGGIQSDPPFRNGTHDADRIAETHAAGIKNYGALRFRVQSEGPAGAGEANPPSDLDVRIAGNNQFLVREENIGNRSGISLDVFADGYLEYWRFDGPAGVRYNRGSIRMAPTVIGWSGEFGAGLIGTYLNGSESTVTRDYVDSPIAYRIVVESPPPALAEVAVDYQAAATVMSDGTVQALTVTYRHEPSGEEVWIRVEYDIGDPSIETPVWYDRAREQLGGGLQPDV